MSTFQTSQYKNIMIISNVNIKFDNHSSIPQCLHLGKQMTTIFCRNLFISDHALRYYCYQQARPPRKIICITDTYRTPQVKSSSSQGHVIPSLREISMLAQNTLHITDTTPLSYVHRNMQVEAQKRQHHDILSPSGEGNSRAFLANIVLTHTTPGVEID